MHLFFKIFNCVVVFRDFKSAGVTLDLEGFVCELVWVSSKAGFLLRLDSIWPFGSALP